MKLTFAKTMLLGLLLSASTNMILLFKLKRSDRNLAKVESEAMSIGKQTRTCEADLTKLKSKAYLLDEKIRELLDASQDSEFKMNLHESKLTYLSELSSSIKKYEPPESIDSKTKEDEYMIELTNRYVDSVKTKEFFTNAVETGLRKQINVPEEMKEKVDELVKKYYSWEVFKPSIIEAYKETFTIEELETIVAFNETSIGRSISTKIPEVLNKISRTTKMEIEQNKLQLAREIATLKGEHEIHKN